LNPRAPTTLLALAVAICYGAACNKGLLPGNAYDQPIFGLITGRIQPGGGLLQAHNPMVSVLWTDPLQRTPDVTMPAQSLRSSLDIPNDTFSIGIFRPPPAAALSEVIAPSGESVRLGFGEIVVVDDRDDDGTFQVTGRRGAITAPDRFLGSSPYVLTYVAQPPSSPTASTPLTLNGQTGYALVSYSCQGPMALSADGVGGTAVPVILQPSDSFPEVRDCRRFHSP
jgi:hypothetical protein